MVKEINKRLKLLNTLGGLPDNNLLGVQNREWLYMLEEETRQSLSIEGYFATEEELEAVLTGRKTQPEILNYFRTAQSMYDLALQYHREEEQPWQRIFLDVPLIKHIHSELFREIDSRRGQFRTGSIQIQGAKVTPPEFDINNYIRNFVSLVPKLLEAHPPMSALARIHAVFESIHPFPDGNGRVGRIILNYLAIISGIPPIIIKGIEQSQRDAYYHALEQADKGFHKGFLSPEKYPEQLEEGNFTVLKNLLTEGVIPQLDTIIILVIEQKESLSDFNSLSEHFKVQTNTLRQWVTRGKLIAVKRDGKLWSHHKLLLTDNSS